MTGCGTDGEIVVVSSTEHIVRGLGIDAGETVWCVELDTGAGEFSTRIVLAGPIVAALTGTAVVGLDPLNGSELWRRSLNSSEATLRGGDLLWVLDGSAAGTPIKVLDPLSGDEVTAPDPGNQAAASFTIGAPPTRVGELVLSTVDQRGGSNRQSMSLSVSNDESIVWEAEVPGFVAALVDDRTGPLAVVLDQTGGSGELTGGPDTTLSAYALTDGGPLWQLALPGTPHLISQISDGAVAVPVGTDMHAIDLTTGLELWVSELSSAGRGGSYDLPGTFWFVATTTTDTAVAVGYAEQPYRD